ncbi:hypothetical protein SNE40_013588 [Patella caerulea]|uniref:Sarcospan n=1 Tax=Patella caerulea TaxID=87958 RepID=A0AAN8PB43_PATCE
MVTSRPRAHSASSIKLTLINSRDNSAARSTPELRSMLTGLETTVPQNLSPDDFSTTHRPRRVKRKAVEMTSADDGCCVCCKRCCGCCRCCRCHILLVILQLLLGCGITALTFYVHLYYPVIGMRETPYWAGVPLTLAGLVGIYFCCAKLSSIAESSKSCVIQALCFIFSIVAIFVNVIASVFPAIQLYRIYTYITCRLNVTRCECFNSDSRVFLYPNVYGCGFVYLEIKYYMFIIGGLCLLGAIVSLWFVILLWKERYGRFYSGAGGDTPVLRRRRVRLDIARLPPEA